MVTPEYNHGYPAPLKKDLIRRSGLVEFLRERVDHARVVERRDVAELAAFGDVAQQPSHDLAGAGLGQVGRPDDPLRPRQLADPRRDLLAHFGLELRVALVAAGE